MYIKLIFSWPVTYKLANIENNAVFMCSSVAIVLVMYLLRILMVPPYLLY